MKKSLLHLSFLLIATQFFLSCGSEYQEPDSTTSSSASSVANGTEACVQTYYESVVIPEVKVCGGCHNNDGAAFFSEFTFPHSAADGSVNYNTNEYYNVLKEYVLKNPQTFINRIDGTENEHGENSIFPAETISVMQTFSDYARAVSTCIAVEPVPIVTPIPIASVTKATYPEMLNLAALIMLDRPASAAELATVTDEATLDSALDTYMNEDAFYHWIKYSFNEFLLTDKYADDNESVELLADVNYTNAGWYEAENNATKDELKIRTNYGINRAPLELVANVVKANGSFGDILKANYIMVNPFSVKSYGAVYTSGRSTYTTGDDLNSSEFSEHNFSTATVAGIPHAGILTDVVLLNRMPTTRTNLNRERASKVMRWFLNTDILELASRAITSSDQSEVYVNPTLENPNCAVCHKVMDPVTGTFKNWDDIGHFQNSMASPSYDNWPTDSGPVGMDLENLIPADQNGSSLQWLAGEIVADERFRRASVNMFYTALTSRKPLKEPSTTDINYADKMQAFIFQDYIFNDIDAKFLRSGLNAKELIKDIIKSEVFSAINATEATTNNFFGESIGLAQMITPEVLDSKITNLIGYSWTDRFDTTNGSNESGNHYLLTSNNYRALYGGIDSDEITTRPDGFNGIMAAIQSRMSIELGCFSAPREFFFTSANRTLFPNVEVTDLPDDNQTTQATINRIKTTISELHNRLLGEQTTMNSPEVLDTFSLLYNVQKKGLAAIAEGTESSNISSMCQITVHPDTGVDLVTDDNESVLTPDGSKITKDSNYIIRAWSAVLTHILADYKFIYNSKTN
jgi:hypothetical protein